MKTEIKIYNPEEDEYKSIGDMSKIELECLIYDTLLIKDAHTNAIILTEDADGTSQEHATLAFTELTSNSIYR